MFARHQSGFTKQINKGKKPRRTVCLRDHPSVTYCGAGAVAVGSRWKLFPVRNNLKVTLKYMCTIYKRTGDDDDGDGRVCKTVTILFCPAHISKPIAKAQPTTPNSSQHINTHSKSLFPFFFFVFVFFCFRHQQRERKHTLYTLFAVEHFQRLWIIKSLRRPWNRKIKKNQRPDRSKWICFKSRI